MAEERYRFLNHLRQNARRKCTVDRNGIPESFIGQNLDESVYLDEDLNLSDDSVADPDFKLPKNVAETKKDEDDSDCDTRTVSIQTNTTAQVQIHKSSCQGTVISKQNFEPLKDAPEIDNDDSDCDAVSTGTQISTTAQVQFHGSSCEGIVTKEHSYSALSQEIASSFNSNESCSILEIHNENTKKFRVNSGAVMIAEDVIEEFEDNTALMRKPLSNNSVTSVPGSVNIEDVNGKNFEVEIHASNDKNITENLNKRKGRSRKDRENCKKLRNTGQSYVTEKGKIVAERSMQALGMCRMKCNERFLEDERQQCFDEYWTLGTRDRRAMYVANLIIIHPKKTQKTDARTINRDCYCVYTLVINNENKPICKECLCRTLGETKGFVNVVMEKKKDSSSGIIPMDTRGRQPAKTKKSVDDLTSAKKHILSFPSYESHYCRNSTSKKYLSSDLSIAVMYRLYKEACPNPVSLKLYTQCFHDLNLAFKKPAKDTCNTCDLLNIKISIAEGDDKINLKAELFEHQSQAEKAYSEKRKDKDDAKSSESIRAYTFDLQQCLPTPYLKTSVSFYKRQLWSFNLTIHDLANDEANCYMWDETIGGRGANQIASCLWRFLWNLPPEVKSVTFYSDTCGGQNKNNIVALMFMYLLSKHPTLETINHKFLISGHSHMECDSDHAIIERTKKKTQLKLNHLNDWMQLVRTCKVHKPFKVVPMKLEDFYNFAELHSKKGPFSIKKKDNSGNKFLWQPVKWLQYNKPVGEILFKTAIDCESPFGVVNFKKRGKSNIDSFLLQNLSKEPLPISKEKKKDILDLLPLIDPAFHDFYKNIKTNEDEPNDPDLDDEDPDVYIDEE